MDGSSRGDDGDGVCAAVMSEVRGRGRDDDEIDESIDG